MLVVKKEPHPFYFGVAPEKLWRKYYIRDSHDIKISDYSTKNNISHNNEH
ncbi:hypothetical protein [Zooshikella ganghwensis]|nr:hypothetical protein [Zooshikella ganghwensis]